MTTALLICAILGCGAWIAAERRVRRLDQRLTKSAERNLDLRFQYEAQCSELRTKRRLLTEALAAMPDTPRGRELGDAIRVQAWPDQKIRRLERHLSLVDQEPV